MFHSYLHITPSGELTFVWNDDLAGLRDLGHTEITRASHVEPVAPVAPDQHAAWWVDLSPVGGPRSVGPFALRRDALAFERRWLDRLLPVLDAGRRGGEARDESREARGESQ